MSTPIKRTQEWWDLFFLRLAKQYATASKDPFTQVGCVITDGHNEVISIGFNGFPPDLEDTVEGLNNRDFKLLNIVHAEINALSRIPGVWEQEWVKNPKKKFTLYVYPFLPCESCAKSIEARRYIGRVVSTDWVPILWKESIKESLFLFDSNDIEVKQYERKRITE